MPTVVVPFRSSDPKRRLGPASAAARSDLAHAMLRDVVVAALAVGQVLVVASEPSGLPDEVGYVPDPGRGQGAAVRAALDAASAAALPTPYVVVNADLPCATARDVLALAGAVPDAGLALVVAADGTTNALALADGSLFEPTYGPGSAARFEALAPSTRLEAPNLEDDVDTLADLRRLEGRLGANTRRMLARLRLAA